MFYSIITNLVEATGVEPVSESRPVRLSTSVVLCFKIPSENVHRQTSSLVSFINSVPSSKLC
nr:MAG TPA: hypothetical protein [Caudoviricetes sp.]